MAKPFEPIPMPYAPLKKNKKDDTEKQGRQDNEKQLKHKKGKNKNVKSSESSQKGSSSDDKNESSTDGIKVAGSRSFLLGTGLLHGQIQLNQRNVPFSEVAVSITCWLYAYLADS